jgi:DNA-binding MarR family transcriptional regulator
VLENPSTLSVVVDDLTAGEPLIYALVDLVLGLSDRTHALIADVLRELDLSQPLADALWQLDPQVPAPPMRELADKLRCDPSTVTFLADRLEEKNLAFRQVDPSNRRVKTLHLTPAGKDARDTLVTAITTRTPMAHLTPSDQRHLHHLLSLAVGAKWPR